MTGERRADYDSAMLRALPEPWQAVPTEMRSSFERELAAELSAGHPLHGRVSIAIGRCAACDDVLFSVAADEGMFAVVHLTWRQDFENPPWPSTTFVAMPLAESLLEFTH